MHKRSRRFTVDYLTEIFIWFLVLCKSLRCLWTIYVLHLTMGIQWGKILFLYYKESNERLIMATFRWILLPELIFIWPWKSVTSPFSIFRPIRIREKWNLFDHWMLIKILSSGDHWNFLHSLEIFISSPSRLDDMLISQWGKILFLYYKESNKRLIMTTFRWILLPELSLISPWKPVTSRFFSWKKFDQWEFNSIHRLETIMMLRKILSSGDHWNFLHSHFFPKSFVGYILHLPMGVNPLLLS